MKYVMVLHLTVRAVREHKVMTRAWKDEHGDSHADYAQRGWEVAFDPLGIALNVEEKPPWVPGQKLKMTLEDL